MKMSELTFEDFLTSSRSTSKDPARVVERGSSDSMEQIRIPFSETSLNLALRFSVVLIIINILFRFVQLYFSNLSLFLSAFLTSLASPFISHSFLYYLSSISLSLFLSLSLSLSRFVMCNCKSSLV